MADTGLLGINPYFKGVSIDTSKPVNLAIQLEQKNQAKREALDKYFMDYEKSINPAGMRSQDQDIVLKKLNQNKQYYMQNRDKILNPSRFGAEAQSQYMAGFKDILSDISKSKQASAEDKVAMNFYQKAKTSNLDIPDGFMEAIQASQKPIYAGYKPVDLFQFDFNKKYDDVVFTKNVWGGLTLPTKEVESKLPDGRFQSTKTSYLTPDLIQAAASNALNEYRNNPSSTKNFNNLIKDQNIFNTAEREYGEAFKYTDSKTKKVVIPKIENIEEFVVGYALSKKPTGPVSTGKADFSRLYYENRKDARANRGQQPVRMENIFDKTGSGGVPLKIGNSGYEIVAGKVLDKDGNLATVNFKDVSGEKLPPDLFSVLEKYGIDLRKKDKYKMVAKDGKIQSITDSKGNVITRQTIMSAQKKFDTERKGEEPLFYEEEEVSVEPETLAERMRRNQKKS